MCWSTAWRLRSSRSTSSRACSHSVSFHAGSAVILPEVFLKALALARNLGHRVRRFTTVNLDFLRLYRPTVNVVERPTRLGGRGISLVGPHEILVPLVAAALIERTARPRRAHGGRRWDGSRSAKATSRSKPSTRS